MSKIPPTTTSQHYSYILLFGSACIYYIYCIFTQGIGSTQMWCPGPSKIFIIYSGIGRHWETNNCCSVLALPLNQVVALSGLNARVAPNGTWVAATIHGRRNSKVASELLRAAVWWGYVISLCLSSELYHICSVERHRVLGAPLALEMDYSNAKAAFG